MHTSRVSNTHQVIAAMIKGDYDDESNWQMVEYVFDKVNCEGCGLGLKFYNALLDVLWWFGQKQRAARVLQEATKRGLYPELVCYSKVVWSVDVHRLSLGGSLTAVSVWLNDICSRMTNGDGLPELATVVVVRGEMEKSSDSRVFPVANAVYTFLREETDSCFSFSQWSNGRIVCQQPHFKKMLSLARKTEHQSAKKVFVKLVDSDLPLRCAVAGNRDAFDNQRKRDADDRTGRELIVTEAR